LIGLVWHNGVDEVLRRLEKAGASLLWLVPFHALPLLLDAQGWRALLGARAPLPLPLLWWIATVREGVSRLLPVASIGGELVGIRLATRWLPDAHCTAIIRPHGVTLAAANTVKSPPTQSPKASARAAPQ
jgi:hypothetical protein